MKMKLLPNTGHQVLFGLIMALLFVVAIEGTMELDPECGIGWHYTSNVDVGDTTKLSIRRGGCRLKVKMAGDVQLTHDERDIAHLSPEAYLEIDERTREARHRFEARPGKDGEPEIQYSLNGSKHPFDESAQAWFHDVALRLYRKSGLDVEGRVERLWQRGSAEAVLEEVAEISSDHIASQYLQQLWSKEGLTSAQTAESLRIAGRSISSDHTLAEALFSISSAALADEETRNAFTTACRSIGSDYELRRVLTHLLESSDFDPGSLNALLDSARGIASDHEMAILLIQTAAHYPEELEFPSSLSNALATIGSDYEQRRAIEAFLDRPDLGRDLSALLMDSVQSIGSDHEAAEVIVRFAARYPKELPFPTSSFDAVATISSDEAQRRALTAMAERSKLDQESLFQMLESARGIGSDYELAELLIEISHRHELSGRAAEAFERAISTLGSDDAQRRVEAARSDGI